MHYRDNSRSFNMYSGIVAFSLNGEVVQQAFAHESIVKLIRS